MSNVPILQIDAIEVLYEQAILAVRGVSLASTHPASRSLTRLRISAAAALV